MIPEKSGEKQPRDDKVDLHVVDLLGVTTLTLSPLSTWLLIIVSTLR